MRFIRNIGNPQVYGIGAIPGAASPVSDWRSIVKGKYVGEPMPTPETTAEAFKAANFIGIYVKESEDEITDLPTLRSVVQSEAIGDAQGFRLPGGSMIIEFGNNEEKVDRS